MTAFPTCPLCHAIGHYTSASRARCDNNACGVDTFKVDFQARLPAVVEPEEWQDPTPDLLAALEALYEHSQEGPRREAARAAIAKARGL